MEDHSAFTTVVCLKKEKSVAAILSMPQNIRLLQTLPLSNGGAIVL
jgi:hypothetical protein